MTSSMLCIAKTVSCSGRNRPSLTQLLIEGIRPCALYQDPLGSITVLNASKESRWYQIDKRSGTRAVLYALYHATEKIEGTY